MKIYPSIYTLYTRRICTSKEPNEGKPHVRFCEGAHNNLEVITPEGGSLFALIGSPLNHYLRSLIEINK